MSNSESPPRIPTIGGDPREESDTPQLQGKTWFRDLDEAVIEADRCIQCGTCVAACPSDSIGIDDIEDRPTLVRMCTGCSRCWDYCPRSGLRYERLMHDVADEQANEVDTYAARATTDRAHSAGQDGGVVTELLATLIETGELDGALVVTDSDDAPLKGEAYLATTREELVETAGSRYNQTMQLGRLEDLVETADLDDPAIALVGTPCVIEGATALEEYVGDSGVAAIELTVALMCTRSFEYERLRSLLTAHDVDIGAVEELDVTEGDLQAVDETGTVLVNEPVDSFDAAALDGCAECADFLGATADISAGSVGSDEGDTTVLVRGQRGRDAWESARNNLEASELPSPEVLERLTDWNHRRASESLPRSLEPEGALSISYEEHRDAFDDTDRAPRPLNPARVYQYEEWC